MPLIQRLSKMHGFKSRNQKPQILKISVLEKHFKAGELVSPKTLAKKGLIASAAFPVKILSDKPATMSFNYRGVKLNKTLLEGYLAAKKTPKVSKKIS